MSIKTEKEAKQEIKTPLSVMLDMARSEIGNQVFLCMQNNHIPPALMVYVLKDILLDVYQMKAEQASDDFLEMQKNMYKIEKDSNKEF